jgi:hypothetical protein
MDETKAIVPDAQKPGSQHSADSGQEPSGGEAGTTPNSPKTYTEVDVQKIISDAKAEVHKMFFAVLI